MNLKLQKYNFIYNEKQVVESNKILINQLDSNKLELKKGCAEYIFYRK